MTVTADIQVARSPHGAFPAKSLWNGALTRLLPARRALARAKWLFAQRRPSCAFPLLARAARAGFAEAEFLLGCCYLEGAGVPRSRREATRWLERAAEHGYVEAQSRLAVLFVQGFASPTNSEFVGGTSEPCSATATLITCNETTQPDYVSAEKWARRAGEAGSPDAQALLGFILSSGPEAMRSAEEALKWYQRSAKAENLHEAHSAMLSASQSMQRTIGSTSMWPS